MKDGSDAVSDWPLLNALLNTASGATWCRFITGGGVGMGYFQHAGVVIVCDRQRGGGQTHSPRTFGTIPARGSCATPTPATTSPFACAREQGLNCP